MGMEYVTQKKRKGNGITMVKKKSNKFKRHFSHRFMRVPVRLALSCRSRAVVPRSSRGPCRAGHVGGRLTFCSALTVQPFDVYRDASGLARRYDNTIIIHHV